MAAVTEHLRTSLSATKLDGSDGFLRARVVPVRTPSTNPTSPGPRSITDMSAPSVTSEPMEVSTPKSTSPTAPNASDGDVDGKSADHSRGSPSRDQGALTGGMSMAAPPPAAPAIHQPKIVQTAFIHKLYNMLEDPNIQHLISWSSTADSFVMSPSPDFSKVLSQYFKHTNISSFVRQLNMYGFHKERDVFHTGNPDSTLWEFKHGAGNFKRGDINGLREIKRRASRHALVHRENSFAKATPPQPGTPSEPLHIPHESTDTRLANLEYALHDMSSRLQRYEDYSQYLHSRHQAALESSSRLLYINQELSRALLSVIPPDSMAHRDVYALREDIQKQADNLRSLDEIEPPSLSSRQQYFNPLDNPPVSPRQYAQDDMRRPTLGPPLRNQNFYRPTVPSNLSLGARRPYGSIGGASTAQSSPSRNLPPAPPPGPHPLSNVEPPPSSLARRHTSADIRAHGWQPSLSNYPPQASNLYPSSPSRLPEEQRIRDSLSAYSFPAAPNNHPSSRPTTPPQPNGVNGAETFGNWSWGSAANRGGVKDSSAPPTRRGSMAHILNPSDTVERSDEDEDPRGEDDRKRKRR
jgi:hypothetical protein